MVGHSPFAEMNRASGLSRLSATCASCPPRLSLGYRARHKSCQSSNLNVRKRVAIPPSLDFDKIARPALVDTYEALRGWLGGHPRDETAFLNRLTEKLNRPRRKCDVGSAAPMQVETSLSMLHRRGPRQTDKYGCDLAVTLRVEPGTFQKTALFQFKRSADFSVLVERAQLDEALRDPRLGSRAFVLALEEVRQALRIEAAVTLRPAFSGQAQRTFNALDWRSAAEWLYGWLRCDIGPSSIGSAGDGVESLLQEFVVEPPEITLFDDIPAGPSNDLDIVPARAWLQILVTPSEPR